MQISEKHIQIINSDLRRRGITTPSLREDMLDHICILLERELETTPDFKQAYLNVLKQFDSFKKLQAQLDDAVESKTLLFKFLKFADYVFTLFYILLGLFSLILPVALLFYHPIEIFLLLSPLLIFGYIICFTRIDYRKFELIQFKLPRLQNP